jgi:hypothetical protein
MTRPPGDPGFIGAIGRWKASLGWDLRWPAAAASTSPALETLRKDLAIIACEPGLAACLSGDFAAAKIYV